MLHATGLSASYDELLHALEHHATVLQGVPTRALYESKARLERIRRGVADEFGVSC